MATAGERIARLTFQQRAVDDRGQRLGDWELPGVVQRGRVVARTRGEVALEQRLQGVQPVEVTILRSRAAREIDNAWRMLWDGMVFKIIAVARTEDRREISILAQADQSDE